MTRKFLFAFVLLLTPHIAHADEAQLIAKALEAKEMLFQRDYEGGMKLFRELQVEYPDSPTGAFGEMAAWQLKMFENYDFRFQSAYKAAENKFSKLSKRILTSEIPLSDWDLFVCGAADGMRSFFKSRHDEWMGAISTGMHAHRLLKQLIWRNPQFIDANLGLGLYDYWRSRMTQQLKFLPFFPDKRSEGIAEIKSVIDGGKYAKDLAQSNLAMVYFEENRYADAISQLEPMTARYPRNIILKMLLGRSYAGLKHFDDAIKQFEQVSAIDRSITKAIYYKAMQLRQIDGRDAEALKLFADYLATNPEAEWASATHYYIGVIAEKQKDMPKALEEYKKALEINKKMKDAKTAVDRLEKLSNPSN